MQREAAAFGELPAKKLAAMADILAAIPDDLPGLRGRVLLLVGFAGALRRFELAMIRVEHLKARRQGGRCRPPVWDDGALPGARVAALAGRRRHRGGVHLGRAGAAQEHAGLIRGRGNRTAQEASHEPHQEHGARHMNEGTRQRSR